MCNACGNLCCGSDEFGGCGCDHCDDPACWSICDLCGECSDYCDCYDDYDVDEAAQP